MAFSRAQLLLLLAFETLFCCAPAAPFAPRAVIVNNSQLRTEYDYVIIGGGTSGLVVANRLTENRNGQTPNDQLRPKLKTDRAPCYSDCSGNRIRASVRLTPLALYICCPS